MSRSKRYAVLVTVCAAVLVINLDTTVVNVALPTLANELDADTRDLQWIVDGYNLAFAALVLAAGSLSDKFGRRPALILGLLVFAGMSVGGAYAGSSTALIAWRFGMGASAALIFPTTLSIIRNTFEDRSERAAALGIWGATVGLGVGLGPVTGGAVLEHFWWGGIFLALAPVALVTALLAAVLVPESRDPDVPALDKAGLVVSVLALGLLTATVIEAPEFGWTSGLTLGGFAVAALLLALLTRIELRVTHPMLDVSLFRDPRFSAAAGAVTVAFFALFGFIFLITQYMQFIRDWGPFSTGARILPVAVSIAVASVAGTRLLTKLGTNIVVTTGLLVFGSAFLWISTLSPTASYAYVMVPQMVLLGTGVGLIQTPATESILNVLPPSRAGVGSAVNDATRELGGTLGVAVVGSLFASIYAGSLDDSPFTRLPERLFAEAKESVGVSDIAVNQAGQLSGPLSGAMDSAFSDGLQVACLMIGGLCILSALISARFMPGLSAFAKHAATNDPLDDQDNLTHDDHGHEHEETSRPRVEAAAT